MYILIISFLDNNQELPDTEAFDVKATLKAFLVALTVPDTPSEGKLAETRKNVDMIASFMENFKLGMCIKFNQVVFLL